MGMSAEEKAAWLSARAGKLTASRMAAAMSYLKDGKTPSSERRRLMMDLLAERLTGASAPHFVSDAMQHGIDYEDEAVDWFVELTGRDVRPSKFYEHPTIDNFGATPDRELDDGLIEVKCPTSATFISYVMAGVVPPEYRPQMTAQLLCSGKRWCGFIAYDPRIRDERKRLFMRRFEPTQEERDVVEAAAIKFLDELDVAFDTFVSAPLQDAA